MQSYIIHNIYLLWLCIALAPSFMPTTSMPTTPSAAPTTRTPTATSAPTTTSAPTVYVPAPTQSPTYTGYGQNGIGWYGGKTRTINTGVTSMYNIYYGNWNNNSATSLKYRRPTYLLFLYFY